MVGSRYARGGPLIGAAVLAAGFGRGCSESGSDACVPQPPYIEQCREVAACTVLIVWRVNEAHDWSVSVDSWDVHRRAEGGADEHVHHGGDAARRFTDFDLLPGTTYIYSLTASNRCGTSARSVERRVTTAPPEPAGGVTWRVPADLGTIQAGLDAASPGDTVLLACGTYGPFTQAVSIPTHGVVLRGETGDPDCVRLDFSGSEKGLLVLHPAWVRIEGLTIKGVVNDGWGGGIKLQGRAWDLARVSDCVLRGNTARNGGGVAAVGASAVISRCVFTGNTGTRGGGGVMVHGGEVRFVDCSFGGNHSPLCPEGWVSSTCILVGCECDTSLWCNGGAIILE